jgi:hypothetical protein
LEITLDIPIEYWPVIAQDRLDCIQADLENKQALVSMFATREQNEINKIQQLISELTQNHPEIKEFLEKAKKKERKQYRVIHGVSAASTFTFLKNYGGKIAREAEELEKKNPHLTKLVSPTVYYPWEQKRDSIEYAWFTSMSTELVEDIRKNPDKHNAWICDGIHYENLVRSCFKYYREMEPVLALFRRIK